MTDEDKLLHMFDVIHGIPTTGSCSVRVYEDDGIVAGVHLMKGGNISWTATKLDLLFDYVTKDLKQEN